MSHSHYDHAVVRVFPTQLRVFFEGDNRESYVDLISYYYSSFHHFLMDFFYFLRYWLVTVFLTRDSTFFDLKRQLTEALDLSYNIRIFVRKQSQRSNVSFWQLMFNEEKTFRNIYNGDRVLIARSAVSRLGRMQVNQVVDPDIYTRIGVRRNY